MGWGAGGLGCGMRIAVIGTGNIGGTLGGRWRAAGYDVVYGSRGAGGTGPGGAPQATVADAVAGADVIVFAIPGPAVAGVASEHAGALDDAVVIDATNRIGAPEFHNRAAITAAAPGAKYVRAFNTLGWENFADPLPGSALFFAGAPAARATVEELINAIGLTPAYLGDADAADTVDALLPLWFALVKHNGGNRRVALRIVQLPQRRVPVAPGPGHLAVATGSLLD
jgi:8-hydroxy-5-deazaflavin:NADPH oxidoreductase